MTAFPNDPVRHAFTYGTLMSTATGAMGEAERALLKAFARRIGNAEIRGRMYDAGACPAVVLEAASHEIVTGELWQVPLEVPELLEALDRYEGCAADSPLPHPYARHRIDVSLPSGEMVPAWIYLWVRSTDSLARIADGKWRGPSAPTLISHAPAPPLDIAAA